MSVQILTRDDATLPNLMLDLAKRYLRVDHCDDDLEIQLMIGAALDLFERTRGVTLYPTEYAWDGMSDDDFVNGLIEVTTEQRITPISAFTATIPGSPPVDVSSQYSLTQAGLHGAVFYSLAGANQAGLSIAITSGYSDPDRMPAGIRAIVYQLTSKLYEYRDVITASNLEILPNWLDAELSGFWVPRA